MHVPANPVPWHPHTERFDAHPSPGLSLDNSHITSRDDALVYRTAPSKSSSRLIGRAELLLYAETDNDDADWIALLADVFPAGARTVQLARAAVRAAATPGFAPNTAVKYVLTFDDIDHVLLPGHSLQLTIVSSLFPLFAVNPGDADYLGASTSRCGSHQVLHDAEHPSALTLQAVTAAAPTSQAMSADDLSVGLPTGEQ
jgi:predicted acyl esterase